MSCCGLSLWFLGLFSWASGGNEPILSLPQPLAPSLPVLFPVMLMHLLWEWKRNVLDHEQSNQELHRP